VQLEVGTYEPFFTELQNGRIAPNEQNIANSDLGAPIPEYWNHNNNKPMVTATEKRP
jgi:hypothetical protein